jgi:archaellum component FlaC
MSADMDHIEDLMERQSDITNEINKLKSTRDSAARQFADPEMGEPMARDEASDRGAESDPATAGAPAIEKQRAELAAAERELARIEKEIAREIEANDPVSLKANLAEAERARQLAELTAACRE